MSIKNTSDCTLSYSVRREKEATQDRNNPPKDETITIHYKDDRRTYKYITLTKYIHKIPFIMEKTDFRRKMS